MQFDILSLYTAYLEFLASAEEADAIALLQGIDAAAIKAFAQKLLSGKPSGVLVGDQAVMPKFDTISSRFS